MQCPDLHFCCTRPLANWLRRTGTRRCPPSEWPVGRRAPPCSERSGDHHLSSPKADHPSATRLENKRKEKKQQHKFTKLADKLQSDGYVSVVLRRVHRSWSRKNLGIASQITSVKQETFACMKCLQILWVLISWWRKMTDSQWAWHWILYNFWQNFL